MSGKILIAVGIFFFILAVITPWYLTQPIGGLWCDALSNGKPGICNPMLAVFVFFGLMVFFAAIGMLLVYVAIVNSGKKPSRKAKRQI